MINTKLKTEEEIREDIVNDYKTSMFVEAGAGAGKTTILINRILKQLESGFAKPSEIVAITFTKKAAEEMKTRMSKAYKGDDLDKMQISTIHSFCYKLLMEQAFNAKLRLDVAMLEEEDADAEKEEWFSKWYKNIDNAKYKELMDLKVYKVQSLVKKAFYILSDLNDEVVVDIDKNILKHKATDFPIEWQKNKDGTTYFDKTTGLKKETEYAERTEFIANYVTSLVMPLVEEYRHRLNNHYISNDVLLDKAAKLLRNDDARKYYQKKYRCIYVDEFQDTSKVQVDLVDLLCTNFDGTHRDGSLFIVGDPKQSIYRFRGADIPLYNRVKSKYKEMPNVKYYELNYNFRTVEPVLKFVNVNNDNDDIMPNYSMMVSMSPSNDYKGTDVIKGTFHTGHPLECQKDGRNYLYTGEQDKALLVSLITGLVDGRFKIYDKDLGGSREIKYSDFLILCRGTNHMDEYMSEMMKHNIPVQISSIVNTDTNKELLRIRNICRFFAYPYDRGAVESLISTISKVVVSKYNRKELNKILDILKTKTKGMDAYSKLLFVSHNLDLYCENGVTLDKDKIKRITTQVEQMVETIFTTCDNNEMSVYEGIKNFVEKGYEREITLEDDANAVRFMNLHKAKGLEGKIVIVCKRSEQGCDSSIEYDTYHYEGKDKKTHYAISPYIEKNFSKDYYPVYAKNDEIKEIVKQEQIAERNRLAYVEATRPMEVLIVLDRVAACTPLLHKYSFDNAKNIFDVYPKLKYYLENDNIDNRKLKSVDYDKNAFEFKIDDKQKEITYNEISPSQFESEVVIESEEKNPSEVKGAEYGICMHRVFELLVNNIKDNIENDDEIIRIIINKALIENLDALKLKCGDNYERLLPLYKDTLKEDAKIFLDSYVVKDLLPNAKTFHAEYPFMLMMGKDLCNGVADLFIENKDGTYKIVDYKSDYGFGADKEKIKETLYKRYNGQLNMYKEAFSKIYKVDPEKIDFVIYNKYIL